jgi:predicted permease
MNWLSRIFHRGNIYSDLAEEMRLHLEERTEQLMRDGMSRKEAEQAARRAFGNRRVIEERSREIWQWSTLESIWADLRYALRQLRKSPGFTFTVLVSLALGLGANTTIFTFVNALLFLPPPVKEPSRLVEVMQRDPKASGIESFLPLSYPGYSNLRDQNHTLSGFAAFDGDPGPVSWRNAGQGTLLHGQLVSGNFFSVAGIQPLLGRPFLPDEDRAGAALPVMVVSYSFWKQQLGADRSIIGHALTLNGTSYTIVGVAPSSFTGVLIGTNPDFWAPLAMAPVFTQDAQRLTNESGFWLFGLGRLKPEASKPQAQADLTVLTRALHRPNGDDVRDAAVYPVDLVPGPYRGYVAAFTGLLMAVVALVLVIACANAANLLLARAIMRRRELAVRSSLGATRFRIVRQMLTESALLSVAGGAAGILLTRWSIPLLLSLKPASIPLTIEAPLDWRVFSFALLLSLCVGILFGIAPALRTPRFELMSALKDEAQLAGPRRSWLRDSIVSLQIAVCLVLLIGAGLCVRSLFNARSIDPGFSTHNVVLAQIDPESLGYSKQQQHLFYQQLLDRVRALPGIDSVSLTSSLPLGTQRLSQPATIDGFTPPRGQPGVFVQTALVAPGFFSTMGIPILNGHDLSSTVAHPGFSQVVVNEAMAKRFWPGKNPVGQHFKVMDTAMETVGVVKTGKYRSLNEDPQPFMYRPFDFTSQAYLVAHSPSDAQAALDEISRTVRELDPNVVPTDMESIKQYMALPLFAAHTTGVLLASFGAVALLLATIGLSGVVSYSVSQRTNEIGVRMALGADRLDVVRLILKQGMRLTMIGILIGLALSFAATRVLADLLYGIKPLDPLTFAAVSLFLAAIAFVSCYVPAHRAASIDPMKSLRAE